VIAEFIVNNKSHSLFIANYGRKLRMEANIRRKSKVKKAIEFAERMKKVQEKAGVMMLSMKDLVFKNNQQGN